LVCKFSWGQCNGFFYFCILFQLISITFHVWPRFQSFPLQLLLLWACLRNFTSNVNVHSNCTFWRLFPNI
jgi:hypothetical protein